MHSELLISAFVLGFLGSFHCAGMCGPIALALPVTKPGFHEISGRLLYNTGRILTYAILGIVAGLIGGFVSLKGFQSELSIFTGVVILIVSVASLGARISVKFSHLIYSATGKFKRLFGKFLGHKSLTALFMVGLLNGLLPCGLVYIALAASLTTGDSMHGVVYMLLFGAGTLPMMFFISVIRSFFSACIQYWFLKLIPVLTIAVALLLIYRGIVIEQKGSCCENPRHKTSKVQGN